ncbi:MAG: hypothetical protein ACOH1J_08150 [Microbacteriaceae bacterium]
MRVLTSHYDQDLEAFTLSAADDETTVIFPAPGRPIEPVSVDPIGVRHLDGSRSIIYPSPIDGSAETLIVIATRSTWPLRFTHQISQPLTHAEASNLIDAARGAYDPYIHLRVTLHFTPENRA